MEHFGSEILGWNLVAYGNIIRGGEETSEDQVGCAVTPEMAQLMVHRFNYYSKIEKALRRLIDENIVLEKYEGEERERHISAHVRHAINGI